MVKVQFTHLWSRESWLWKKSLKYHESQGWLKWISCIRGLGAELDLVLLKAPRAWIYILARILNIKSARATSTMSSVGFEVLVEPTYSFNIVGSVFFSSIRTATLIISTNSDFFIRWITCLYISMSLGYFSRYVCIFFSRASDRYFALFKSFIIKNLKSATSLI